MHQGNQDIQLASVGHLRSNSFQLKTALENSRDVWRLRGGVGARFE